MQLHAHSEVVVHRNVKRIQKTSILHISFFFFFLYSKCGDLEEELKNVTNNLKSLEAQSDKASVVYLS